MFDKIKALMDMQKKMQEVKRELDNTMFDAQSPDGLVKVSMNGSQEVREVFIQDNLAGIDKSHLEKAIKDVYNIAIKRSHDIAAKKMKDVTGLNIPGIT